MLKLNYFLFSCSGGFGDRREEFVMVVVVVAGHKCIGAGILLCFLIHVAFYIC